MQVDDTAPVSIRADSGRPGDKTNTYHLVKSTDTGRVNSPTMEISVQCFTVPVTIILGVGREML